MSEYRDDLIGKKLGQYEILEEIGRGGMATVYTARQGSINRIVAVKVLPRHFLHDPGFFERFEREVDVIAHLEHPHILPIYDYGKADDMPYIAMRFLGGGSMAQLIKRGIPQLDALDRPFTQIAQALDHAHRQGIIHRDLKPGNIMLDEEGNAYLSDFGIARVLGSNLTGSMIIGTPAYMSPEQANGFPLDARSDLYSLGIVLFELITGQEPFQAETPMALLLKHINEPVPPLTNFRPDIPDAVEEVIMKATAKDPNGRYSSASELARAFSAAIRDPRQSTRTSRPGYVEDMPTILPDTGPRGGVSRPTPIPVTPRGMMPPANTAYPQQPTPYPANAATTTGPLLQPPPPARSRTPMIIGGVVLLAILVLAAVFIVPSMTPKDIPVTRQAELIGSPTPFTGAEIINTSSYSLSMPSAWVPDGSPNYIDDSDATRQIHRWQSGDQTSSVSLILQRSDISSDAEFNAVVQAYEKQYYDDTQPWLTLINETTAPDGTIVRSYSVDAENGPSFPAGQLDVFFMRRGPYLTVLEMYSANSTGNDYVPTFQQILDSLQVKST